jgi:hypothetical protein
MDSTAKCVISLLGQNVIIIKTATRLLLYQAGPKAAVMGQELARAVGIE